MNVLLYDSQQIEFMEPEIKVWLYNGTVIITAENGHAECGTTTSISMPLGVAYLIAESLMHLQTRV